MKRLIQKAANTHYLAKKELIEILSSDKENDYLFSTADQIRKEYKGNSVHIRGLIEFSNICKQNCKYCGIRKDNSNVDRYRLTTEEIILFAEHAAQKGLKTVVLQSGEDAFFTPEKMVKIISKIKSLGLALTLSIGEKSTEEYKEYKSAGADRYLLRIETTDRNLYKKLHPNMDFDNRIRCLKDLKKLGYETGTGILIGLPEQTLDSIANDLLFFKELNADMVGLGPFIPATNTPLENELGGTLTQSLKVMALTRLLLPDINIPATTAMETLHPKGRIMALQCGANVIMPNVTEGNYKKKYLLYPGKTNTDSATDQLISETKKMLDKIGRTISGNQGFRTD